MGAEHYGLNIADSSLPRVVVIGGGFAGLNLVKQLIKLPVEVVLFDKYNYHTFQPLLYQVATAGLEPDSIAVPFRKIFGGHKNFFFRMLEVEEVDLPESTVCTSLGKLKFDYLVLATGSTTNFFGNEKLAAQSWDLKEVPHALDIRSHFFKTLERAELASSEEQRKRLMTFVIVGGGPTGVELSGAFGELKKTILPEDYPNLDFNDMSIYLAEGTDRLLPALSESSSHKARNYLKEFSVEVMLNELVTDIEDQKIQFKSGKEIEAATLIWAAGVKGQLITGLQSQHIEHSRIKVNEWNQIDGHSNAFAIGDVAYMSTKDYSKGHPMVAQVAIQQGNQLAKNLKRILEGKENLEPFRYNDKGSMATIGRKRAVVDLPSGLSFSGFFGWLVWLLVHLMFLIGFRNKVIVLSNWMYNYFTYDKSTRLIIRRDKDN